MADPTNISVPPARVADPTNISVPVHGTRFPSGLTGAQFNWSIPQTTDLGASLTSEVVTRFLAPVRGYARKVIYSVYDVTGTVTFDLYNNTQSALIIAAQTITDGAKATVTTFTTPNINESDEIQLRITTAGGGACKGVVVSIFGTELEGTITNPV